MKKKLEAELISIAHRILKLKNKSDINLLYSETQKLYEKLAVLKFVEEHLGDVKPTIGQTEIEEKITAAFESVNDDLKEDLKAKEIAQAEPAQQIEPVAAETEMPAAEEETIPQDQPIHEEPAAQVAQESSEEESQNELDEPTSEVAEMPEDPVAEPVKTEDSFFKPAFELSFDAKDETTEAVKEDAKDEFKDVNAQITFEDILGSSYVDPVFVTPEDLAKENEIKKTDNVIPIGRSLSDSPVISIHKTEDRSYTINDRISKGITIGLNDRVAFMKHLFNNSSEDYNRVLSQLLTFDTFDEAKSFIDNMVKPDYNNWDGKEEYAERFMEIVEKKFS